MRKAYVAPEDARVAPLGLHHSPSVPFTIMYVSLGVPLTISRGRALTAQAVEAEDRTLNVTLSVDGSDYRAGRARPAPRSSPVV